MILSKSCQVDPATLKYFDKFPLSKPTRSALKTDGFTKPTEIQRLALKHALLGCDIVVVADTESGKTLSFFMPVLKKLFVERVTTFDGPAAVILTPTRELSRQICLVLKRFCANFKFTILDIMGDKNSASKRLEWSAVSGANILIGTPGPLAQYMTENLVLDMSNLRILVHDEADRLLDSTFRGDMNTIMTNINPERRSSSLQSSSGSACSMAMVARYAFNAYLNDYCLGSGAPNKQTFCISSVFNLSALPLPEFAESLGLPSLPDLPKRFSAWMSGVSTSPDSVKQLNTASWGPTPKASEVSERSGIECDENDEFLRRKSQYVSALGHLNQQNPSQKLLELVESFSDSSNSDTETKSTKKTFDQATKVDITSSKKKTRVQRVKSELRRTIHTHSKVVFDESGQPVVKTIGGVPVRGF
ncbi:ATP-dependent RNA helicase DBP4 [Fasciolopsis buskii]|uniref:ATP-dependent RNA helicase n=1 Tax=Fasciolopsis buskii TaxID=27845 RepID=A0A8E0VM30_9TREM|nr:ATP-dependent RNA helicase DBP4 [Fasciolopsis buski]